MKPATVLLAMSLFLAACSVPPRPSLSPELAADYAVLLSRAHDHLKARELAPAKEILQQAIDLRPEAAIAYNLLGIAHFLQENLRQAEECFLKAVSLRKDYGAALNNLGNVRFLQGNLTAAKEDFKKALAFSPDSTAAHYSLAMLLLSQGKHEEGMTHLARAIALDPEFLEQQREFTAGIAMAGLTSPETYLAWARAYALQGNAAKAVEFLQKAKEAGFSDWKKIDSDKEFAAIRNSRELLLFLQDL